MPDDTEALNLARGRALFVASTGGHLTELLRLAPAMNAAPDSQWVTFDSEQSRSALRGAHFSFVPYVRPRDYRGTLATVGLIRRTIRRMKPVAVISTGSGVAIGAFIAARLQGVPCYYIESVSRVDGPSLTGRIVAGLHLAHLRTQHATWADERWKPYPSVLSDFESVPAPDAPDHRREPSLFVTLGTIQPYRFDALVDAVLATGLADERTVWQVGSTTRQDLPGRVVSTMSGTNFLQCCLAADVVVTHGGVGTAMTLLEAGVCPVVVPRRAGRGEHVDDHQSQIASLLADKRLAVVAEAPEVDVGSIREAAGLRIRSRVVLGQHGD